MTSQLFDSGNNSEDNVSISAARIIMITMTAFSFVGTFFLVLVKGRRNCKICRKSEEDLA